MKPDKLPWPEAEIVHRMDCPCPTCTAPRPSDPPPALLEGLLYRAPICCAAGMLTGAAIVAATGNLGAALRALFGL